MKICEFCNAVNANDAVKCQSCGGASFKNKCNNCGTVFDGQFCTNCGTRAGQTAKECPVCHTKYFTNACPNCGYNPVKANGGAAIAPAAQQPKRKTWLWVLGWIFIFPVPLMLILLKKPNMNKGLKYGIIIGAWVLYAIFSLAGMANKENEPRRVEHFAAPTEIVTEAQTEASTEALTEVPTEAPTEAPTEPPTEPETEAPTEAPTKAPTEAPTAIVFTEYTDYVEAGSNAFVTIQGAPNTEYSIHVYYSTKESSAEGLENKTSDSSGYVTWEWKVGPNTTPGAHSITVKGGGTESSVSFTTY